MSIGNPLVFTQNLLFCRACRRWHSTFKQLRECTGHFCREGEDYILVPIQTEDPWPQDKRY